MTDLIIEKLKTDHNRSVFSCGKPALDDYIRKRAGQDEKRDVSRVYVASFARAPLEIAGFYTLSSCSIDLLALPPDVVRKLPRHPMPAVLIGRLAVSELHHGEGLGALLLADALQRIKAANESVAVYAVVVDAKDDQAASFYEHFGFKELMTGGNRWYLPVSAF